MPNIENKAILEAQEASFAIESLDDPFMDIIDVADEDLRKKLLSMKLSSRIFALAYQKAVSGQRQTIDSALLLDCISDCMSKLSAYRSIALGALKIEDEEVFSQAFNHVTSSTLELLQQEIRFSSQNKEGTQPILSAEVMGALLEKIFDARPDVYDAKDYGDVTVTIGRRLGVLDALVPLSRAINIFDYFQKDRAALLEELLKSVVIGAEKFRESIGLTSGFDTAPTYYVNAISRCYSTSAGLMCETYKMCAATDVNRLKSMDEKERSMMLVYYENCMGMSFTHVIGQFESYLKQFLNVSKTVLEAL